MGNTDSATCKTTCCEGPRPSEDASILKKLPEDDDPETSTLDPIPQVADKWPVPENYGDDADTKGESVVESAKKPKVALQKRPYQPTHPMEVVIRVEAGEVDTDTLQKAMLKTLGKYQGMSFGKTDKHDEHTVFRLKIFEPLMNPTLPFPIPDEKLELLKDAKLGDTTAKITDVQLVTPTIDGISQTAMKLVERIYDDEADVRTAFLELGDLASDVEESERYAQCCVDIINPAAVILSDDTSPQDTLRAVLTVTWYLCRETNFRLACLHDEDFVSALLDVVRTAPPSVTRQGMRTLNNLALADEAERILIRDHNVLSILANMLSSQPADIQGAICGLIRNLAASKLANGRAEFIKQVLDEGVLGQIVPVLHANDQAIVYRAAAALGSLAHFSKDCGLGTEMHAQMTEPLPADTDTGSGGDSVEETMKKVVAKSNNAKSKSALETALRELQGLSEPRK